MLSLELKPGLDASGENTMMNLPVWAGALMFGPTALWLEVGFTVFKNIHRWRKWEVPLRWNMVRNKSVDLARATFVALVALTSYEALGGHYPTTITTTSILAGLAATTVYWLAEMLLNLPFMVHMKITVLSIINPTSPARDLYQFLAVVTSMSYLVAPFSVLLAALYGEHGIGAFLFLASGALMAAGLAHNLSTASAFSQQRSREMEHIEALGRDIIAAPPDASTLPDLLVKHAPSMIGMNALEIRFFPDQILVHSPEAPLWPDLKPEVWEWARTLTEPYRILPKQIQPWNNKPSGAGQLFTPIKNAEDDTVIGGIYVGRFRQANAITGSMAAMQALAAQITSALHRAEEYRQTLAHQKMMQEMAFAERIQASFLPTALPEIPGWQVAVTLQSARQTSGDFYDLFVLPNGCLGIVVADVADKGMGAALYMALSRTLLRTYAFEYPDKPALALQAANARILADTHADLFVTLFYGVIDLNSGTLTYCNAGHNPALLLHSDTVQDALRKTGIPLGMFESSVWKEQITQLEPGDKLVMYTDGVTEAQNEQGALFGETRLADTLRTHRNDGVGEICTELLNQIAGFASGAPQSDDITLAIVARL
jgi:serine phosphatase RsbU (regulator of sigma subunit)